MLNRISNTHLLFWSIPTVYYLIGLAGIIYQPFHTQSIQLMNSGSERNFLETSLIEALEAIFWLAALVVYLLVLKKKASMRRPILWIIIFCILSLIAFGEETSWGQHFFRYSPPQFQVEFNFQKENNVHNINITKLLGFPTGSVFYSQLNNLTKLLNPIFYLFCAVVWLILPAILGRKEHTTNFRLFRNFPRQSNAFYVSFFAFTVLYLFVDRFLFDAGELYELTLSIAGCLTAINQYHFTRLQNEV